VSQFVVGPLVYLVAAYLAFPTGNSTVIDSRAIHLTRSSRSYFPYQLRGHYYRQELHPGRVYRYPNYFHDDGYPSLHSWPPPVRSHYDMWDHPSRVIVNYGRGSNNAQCGYTKVKFLLGLICSQLIRPSPSRFQP
jgi:hypothetical protein